MEVKVRVQANARKERVERSAPDRLKISVREKAEDNAANRRVIELVALHFGIPSSRVRILRGHRAPSKTLSIG